MDNKSGKHENYELLNLLGYGLAKFDNDLIKEFDFNTKQSFYDFFVDKGLVKTASTVKNRMDLFDPYFDNGRKGWWQKADAYKHRKILIDSLFGDENVKTYANIIKLFLNEKYNIKEFFGEVKPITRTRFNKLQQTGLEAEQFFITNFNTIEVFHNGVIADARLYGDGYDFQVDVGEKAFLVEVKGIKKDKGKFRLTENEHSKASEYTNDYFIAAVMDLENNPTFKIINNPLASLKFTERITKSKQSKEFHLASDITL
ncbi:MAG: DUF3883 domain-containing protein [Candidatus Nomurabacteria bacterium]|jgi:hypothetical protein|nr:DUF3883 domain-containing protein [Candidatus Nomurabacteria bacterium]